MFFSSRFGRAQVALLAVGALAALAACSSGNVSSPPPAALSAVLASATNSLCVTAQGTPQSVSLPDTGGVTAQLSFAQYDNGASGCQNITISTGSAAAATASTVRRTDSTTPAPIISITLGQGLPQNSSVLGITTVLSGATLTTDSNTVFPDGTYNATTTLNLGGASITYSLVFTASGGKLTLTGGNALPLTLASGATINVYNRGVIPPNFEAVTPTPTPTASATPAGASPSPTASPSASPLASPTPTPSPTPTATPSSGPGAAFTNGQTIGTFTEIIGGLPANLYGNGVTYTGNIVYNSPGGASSSSYACTQDQTTGNFACTYTGSYFDASIDNSGLPGTVSYALSTSIIKSYRIDGCTGHVSYGGNGVAGTLTIQYVTLAASDTCEVDLFSVPAATVNTAPNNGFAYDIYVITGPVAQPPNGYVYPPAIDV